MKKTYEEQKEDILKIAEDYFGNDFFERLDKLSRDYSSEEEKPQEYSLTLNHKGAFYASTE